MHAHAHAIVLTYAHALDLSRADAITHTCAADPDLIRTLDLTPARALADAIARDLAALSTSPAPVPSSSPTPSTST